MKYCLCILMLLTFPRFSQADQEFKLFDPTAGKYKSIEMISIKGRLVSSSCKKASNISCEALNPKSATKLKKGAPLLGHPASSYCSQVGGKSRILFDSKNDQYDYCLFKDGSMTDSWQLYNESTPK